MIHVIFLQGEVVTEPKLSVCVCLHHSLRMGSGKDSLWDWSDLGQIEKDIRHVLEKIFHVKSAEFYSTPPVVP